MRIAINKNRMITVTGQKDTRSGFGDGIVELTRKILKENGISAEVINIHSIKPLDSEAVLNSILKTGCAVSAEEHNVIGGLGDSIPQTAVRQHLIPIEFVGTNDTFGESGTPAQLLANYGLDAAHIVAAAEKMIARKNK